MFGWPMLPSADLPGGGPAYPLSALGVRARAHLTDTSRFWPASSTAAHRPTIAATRRRANRCGASFPLNGGVLAIAELQYAYPGSGTLVQADEADPLSRTYKIGVWYDSETFRRSAIRHHRRAARQSRQQRRPRDATRRLRLLRRRRPDGLSRAEDPDRNINVFVRPMFTPLQDRNLIDFSVNAGFTMHEPFLGRDDDTFGIGVGSTPR